MPKPKDFVWVRGHTLSLRHGTHSPRTYTRLAETLAARLLKERPDLAQFRQAVMLWSIATTRAALIRHHLDEHGMVDEDGKLRNDWLRWESTFLAKSAEFGRMLGLDPRSAAELAKATNDAAQSGFDIDAALAEARRREAIAEAAPPPAIEAPADDHGDDDDPDS